MEFNMCASLLTGKIACEECFKIESKGHALLLIHSFIQFGRRSRCHVVLYESYNFQHVTEETQGRGQHAAKLGEEARR